MKRHLVLLMLPLLVGCGSNTASDDEEIKVDDSSLKGILTYLNEGKNYSFIYRQDNHIVDAFQYEKNSIARINSDSQNNLKMYIQDEQGIYMVGYDNDRYLPGEYISKDQDLYNSDSISTFFGKGKDFLSTLNGSETSIDVVDKQYKMDALLAFGFTRYDYVKLNTFEITYADKAVTFTFTLSNSNYIHSFETNDLGTTKIFEAKDFLKKGGKAFVPDYDLKVMREYFLASNFVRRIYDMNTNKYIGVELFNDKYFYSETSSLSNEAYLELVYNGVDPDSKNPINLNGVYRGTLYGSRSRGFTSISMQSTPYNTNPNVKEVFHYPLFMSLWNNLQYLRTTEEVNINTYKSNGVVYTTNNQDLVVDFAINFSIDQAFPFNTCTPTKLSIDVSIRDDDSTKSNITFLYYYLNGGVEYCMLIPFSEFGGANISLLDSIVKAYSN